MKYRGTKSQVKMLINGKSLTNQRRKFTANNETIENLKLIDENNMYDNFNIIINSEKNSIEIEEIKKEKNTENYVAFEIESKKFPEVTSFLNYSLYGVSVKRIIEIIESTFNDIKVLSYTFLSKAEFEELHISNVQSLFYIRECERKVEKMLEKEKRLSTKLIKKIKKLFGGKTI